MHEHATPSTSVPDLCSEDEVIALVHRFYDKVRADSLLGPVFDQHIDDWDAHLSHLVDFWSAMLRGTRRFNGTPMPKHMALRGLTPMLFQRWLALFADTTRELDNPGMKATADARAEMIAARFWQQYRLEGHDQPADALISITGNPP